MNRTYSVGQIFSSKDTTQTFLIINDQNTVGPLGRTKLTSLRHSQVFWYSQSGTGLQRSDSAFLDVCLVAAPTRSLSCRNSTLSRKLGFDLLPDSLARRIKFISKTDMSLSDTRFQDGDRRGLCTPGVERSRHDTECPRVANPLFKGTTREFVIRRVTTLQL